MLAATVPGGTSTGRMADGTLVTNEYTMHEQTVQLLRHEYATDDVTLLAFPDQHGSITDGKLRFMGRTKGPRYSQILDNTYVRSLRLSGTAYDVLHYCFQYLDKNAVSVRPREIADSLGVSIKAVYIALTLLRDHALVLKVRDGYYLLNPHYFWRGVKAEIIVRDGAVYAVNIYDKTVKVFDALCTQYQQAKLARCV